MYNPMTPWVAKHHQDQLLKEAERNRIVKPARRVRPQRWQRLFLRLGDLLITIGLSLHRRFQPAVYPDPELYQPHH
jgi:hypothetical protein